MQSGRIDSAHPVVVAWCAARGIDHAAVLNPLTAVQGGRTPGAPIAPSSKRAGADRPASAAAGPTFDEPIDINLISGMTVREVVERWGSRTACADWVALRKQLADLRRLELANDETSGELISRDFVRQHVFAHIDLAYARLLQDTAATIALRLTSMVKSGGSSAEQCVAVVRELIGAQLALMKQHAVRALHDTSPRRAGEAA